MQPRTQYVDSNGVSIAFQVLGEGPIDLVLVPGFISHLDLQWTDPLYADFFKRLASFSRLILFDKRGTGLSDPVPTVPTLEERMEDVHAVMDAAGSEQAALFGLSEGGPMAVLFAATYPERTTRLILWGSFAKGTFDEVDGLTSITHPLRRLIDTVSNNWGDGSTLDLFSPSLAAKGDFQRQLRAVFERAAASPSLARALIQAIANIDVSAALPTIRVPTLVLHRTGDVVPIAAGRYVADHIPGARFVEFPGDDHIPWFDPDTVLDETERFVTGTRHAPTADRVLMTVLFTDIVSSTAKAAAMGDHEWRAVLEQHDRLVRKELEEFNGREVKTTGDGFLATFDGPARAIRCACAIRDRVADELGLGVRAGIHTGECEVIGDDIAGMAVHIGARVGAIAGDGEVLVSSTVKDLVVGSGLEFDDRGEQTLKGVPGTWRLLAVRGQERPVPTIAVEEKGRAERAMLLTAKRAPSVARFLARASDRRFRKGASSVAASP